MKLKFIALLVIILFRYNPTKAQVAPAPIQYSISDISSTIINGGSDFRLDNVFKDKTIGVEFNFIRLFFTDNFTSYSGTISLFKVEKNSEIAFPVYYIKCKYPEGLTEYTVDCQFRHFINGQKNGFYVSAFTRYANMEGALNNIEPQKAVTNKLGVGLGIGFRKFTESGFYIGFNISYGKYLFGKNNIFSKLKAPYMMDDDRATIRDFEAFKIGWAF